MFCGISKQKRAMSDFAFLQTGFADVDVMHEGAHLDMIRKVVSLLKVLQEHAIRVSQEFAHTCGRETACERDMVIALRFLTHEFFTRDIDAEFQAALEEECKHTYQSSEESEEEGESEESEEGDESEESEESKESKESGESEECAMTFVHGDFNFHQRATAYDAHWVHWSPSDPIQALLKRAVDAAHAQTLGDQN